jgi:hypothetical protein
LRFEVGVPYRERSFLSLARQGAAAEVKYDAVYNPEVTNCASNRPLLDHFLIPDGEWKFAQIPEKHPISENVSNAPNSRLDAVTDVIHSLPEAICHEHTTVVFAFRAQPENLAPKPLMERFPFLTCSSDIFHEPRYWRNHSFALKNLYFGCSAEQSVWEKQ